MRGEGGIAAATRRQYIGSLRDGRPCGEGKETFPTGDIFEGTFREGFITWGTHTLGTNCYVGTFAWPPPTWDHPSERYHGRGVLRRGGAVVYDGEWKRGRYHGHGAAWTATTTFAGLWHEGMKVRGIETSDDGLYYQGEFQGGQFAGLGMCVWPGGAVYEGEFRGGVMDGFGTLSTRGWVYTGDMKEGVREGYGRLVWDDGDVYRGDFRADLMHGYGTYVYSDGRTVTALWAAGAIAPVYKS